MAGPDVGPSSAAGGGAVCCRWRTDFVILSPWPTLPKKCHAPPLVPDHARSRRARTAGGGTVAAALRRCQWFAFNRHRGWTALVAVEVVAATLLLMVLWFGVSLVLRSPFQFSIRSLLLLALIIAIPSLWLAPERQRARKQRDAVEQLEKAGATVAYGWDAIRPATRSMTCRQGDRGCPRYWATTCSTA